MRIRVLLVCLFGLPVSALAVTARDHVTLEGDRVHLSDLFEGVSKEKDVDIGDAPALGEEYEVKGDQLTAIAAQFSLDWYDASPAITVHIRHGARVFGIDRILPLVEESLGLDPQNPDFRASISDFKPLAAPLHAAGELRVIQSEYHPEREGTFFVTVRLDGPGAVERRYSGTVVHTRAILCLRHGIQPGDPITFDNIQHATSQDPHLSGDALRLDGEAVGLTARVPLAPDRPLLASQLNHPMLVHKGGPILMSLIAGDLHVTASGYALEDGALGTVIHVVNPGSNSMITGRVTDRAQIEVLPGSSPVPMNGRNGGSRASSQFNY